MSWRAAGTGVAAITARSVPPGERNTRKEKTMDPNEMTEDMLHAAIEGLARDIVAVLVEQQVNDRRQAIASRRIVEAERVPPRGIEV